MSNFRPTDRNTDFLMPPSVDEWLPERHLARFIVEVVEQLDLRAMTGSYRGSGSASYHPRVLLSLLIYGYATGVFSSRRIEQATYDSVAFRYLACNRHPDHDTLATFRRRFGAQLQHRYGLPLHWVDERLTSHAAALALRDCDLSAKKRRRVLDQAAACEILSTFLDGGRP
jgi:putative transcription antitermination factor YqgF